MNCFNLNSFLPLSAFEARECLRKDASQAHCITRNNKIRWNPILSAKRFTFLFPGTLISLVALFDRFYFARESDQVECSHRIMSSACVSRNRLCFSRTGIQNYFVANFAKDIYVSYIYSMCCDLNITWKLVAQKTASQ